ncbi:hypothetical protein SLS64_011445 [Diaporthe eres]
MQNISNIADFDPQRLGEKPWQDEWRSEFFNKLWELRRNIDLLGFDMGNTIRLFSNLADNMSWPEMQNLDTVDGGRWGNDRHPSHNKIRDQDQDDLKEWENLEATREYAAGFIERTTNSYLQAATAEGTKFSNVQAKTYFQEDNIRASVRLFSITLLFKDIRTYINEHWKKDEPKREEPFKRPPGMRKRFLSGFRGIGRRDEEKIV